MRGLLIALVVIAGCESDADRAEKNRQRGLADEAACKDELAGYDQWSSKKLSPTCQRIYDRREQERKAREADRACEPSSDAARAAWHPPAGMRVEGRCHDVLVYRNASCELASIADAIAGKPFVADALAIGITMLVCEHIPDGARISRELSMYRAR